jgi:hypothetical protein
MPTFEDLYLSSGIKFDRMTAIASVYTPEGFVVGADGRLMFHTKSLIKSPKHQPMLRALARIVGEQKKVYPVTWAVFVDGFNSFSLQQRRFMTGATLSPSGKLITSVASHADRLLLSAVWARVTFSRMSLAFAVQMKGLGF